MCICVGACVRAHEQVTTDHLERRHDKMFCGHRTYLKNNVTQYAYGIYQGYVRKCRCTCACAHAHGIYQG